MAEFYDKVKISVEITRILALSIGDFFTKRLLILSLIPSLIAILFWSMVFLLFHSQLKEFAHSLIAYVPFATADWIENIASMVILIFLFYQFVLITVILSLVFLAKKIVLSINEKHYHLGLNGDGSLSTSFLVALKASVIFLLLYLLLLPTLFIPGINVAVHLALWSILIKQPLLCSSTVMVAEKSEYKSLLRKHRWSLILMSVLLSVLYIIPVIGAFVAVFQLVVFAHYSLTKIKQGRGEPAVVPD